ncbi:MAG: RnfABCDGE type electron transport complex subunit D [Tissierellia bacterium]|nr:RnfABCDGE type electron transport complex subunit D [Tissierellia bacterium]
MDNIKSEKIKNAPFFRTKTKTANIMIDVLIALIPVSIMAIVNFGFTSLLFIALGMGSAVLFEYGFQKLTNQKSTINDLSAAVTGLLVALSYPVTAPLWIIIFGSFLAIVVAKQLPGGLGKNPLNPAVFSRVFIKITLTPFMTNWVSPLPDMTSTATPLSIIGFGQSSISGLAPNIQDLFLGNIGGGIGETVKWAILLGFAYLVYKRVISGFMPIATLSGLFMTMLLFGKSDYYFAFYHLLSGTVLFASVFMVTDYTSGPLNPRARIYYAFSIGVLTGILRYTFPLPGGVGIAILAMNLLAPIFDTFTTPKVFGHKSSSNILPSRK